VWALLEGTDGTRLFSSPVGSDTWTEGVAPGPGERHALVPHGDRMLLMTYLGNDTATLGPVSSLDEAAPIPCRRSPLPPRASGSTLWVTCPGPGGGVTVLRSTDASTWTSVKATTRTAPVTYPMSPETTFLVSFEGGRLVGANGVVDVPLELEDHETVDDGVFASAETGYLLTNQGRVLRSDDGGHRWEEIG
jgi:hypothetical protein